MRSSLAAAIDHRLNHKRFFKPIDSIVHEKPDANEMNFTIIYRGNTAYEFFAEAIESRVVPPGRQMYLRTKQAPGELRESEDLSYGNMSELQDLRGVAHAAHPATGARTASATGAVIR